MAETVKKEYENTLHKSIKALKPNPRSPFRLRGLGLRTKVFIFMRVSTRYYGLLSNIRGLNHYVERLFQVCVMRNHVIVRYFHTFHNVNCD